MSSSRRRAEPPRTQQKRNNELSGRLATISDPTSAAAEAYRSLRTNLMYGFVDNPPQLIVLTSPGRGEGKSTICANLSVALAQTDKSVLLVDCDLRKPTIHTIFELPNLWGVVDVVGGGISLQEAAQEPLVGFKVLTSGARPPNPVELLSSKRFAEFLGELRQEFDYILLDTPPVELFSDSLAIAPRGDGVILAIDAQNTRKRAVRQSMRSLQAVKANVLGTIMNNVDVSGSDAYYYEY